MEVYLDNSATTRPDRRVVLAMTEALEAGYFNPSSVYRPALETEKKIAACRDALLKKLGALNGYRVIFTSGGTEADNLAIFGHVSTVKKPGRILYLRVEHPAVKECCLAAKRLGHEAQAIPVTREGIADMQAFQSMLGEDVIMICVMQVNNETGAIQPIEEIARLRDQYCKNAVLHVDGVQGFLRLPIDLKKMGIQSYALSGHKIHGPKGIGALVIDKALRLSPMQWGGGQEGGLRSGTENTPGICGLQAAVEAYPANGAEHMAALKSSLFHALKAGIPGAEINGPQLASPYAAPHILNVSMPPVRSDTMLFALEGSGVYVSSGSACSSKQQKVSETLKAMNTPPGLAQSALRFSLSPHNTQEEIAYAAQEAIRHYDLLKGFVRR